MNRLYSFVGVLFLGGLFEGGDLKLDAERSELIHKERAVSFLEDGSYERDERLANSKSMVEDERHIVVVICSYNNERYYQWNLDSVFAQNYTNYHVLYVDDCSADDTGTLVDEYVKEKGMEETVIAYHNAKRRKALANLYYVIHTCKPTDIIVILDGDDRFAHPNVLQRINQAYVNPDIWLTYGQFRIYPSGGVGFCRPYPRRIVERCGFRYYHDTPSHLRTFRAGLFHKIRREDLMFQDEFFPVTYDLAIMFPMIEMARLHHQFIPDVLVDYNGENPINDHKGTGKQLQRKFDLIIRARTCYGDIESPF